jgi:hypothetical protein
MQGRLGAWLRRLAACQQRRCQVGRRCSAPVRGSASCQFTRSKAHDRSRPLATLSPAVRRTCPEPLSRDDIRELARIVAAGLLASKLDADRGLQQLGIAEALRAPEAANGKQHDAPKDEL